MHEGIFKTPQDKQAVNLSSCPKKNGQKKEKAKLFEVALGTTIVGKQPHGREGTLWEK